jgi:DNA processing protein
MDAPATPFDDKERLARLRLFRSAAIGAATFWALIERYGSGLRAIEAIPHLARKAAGARPVVLTSLHDAEREIEACARLGARFVACGEPDYPKALAQVDMPPPLLAIKGKTDVLGRDMIAVVGARNASALGQRFARDIARDLGEAGLTVVSGLARGIDTAAHKGSLASGTVAVMAGGIDAVYPPENKALYDEIGERGGLVSEMPLGLQPTAQHFPRRNRIISGLALGVVVVEATLNSGSLITARLAGEQGREVFAVPGSPLDPRAKGTNGLLRQGAVLAEGAADVLAALKKPVSSQHPGPAAAGEARPAQPDETSRLQAEILGFLGPAPVEIDELVRLTSAPPATVAAALLDLEFAGRILRHPGQKVSAAAPR